MKKIIILLTITIVSLGAANAFAKKAMDHNVRVLYFGAGFGFHGMYHDSLTEPTKYLVCPPVMLGFDYGVKVHPKVPLTFGGIFGYAQSFYEIKSGGNDFKWTYHYYIIGFRSAFHFTELFNVDKLDFYIGFMIGYTIVSLDEPELYAGTYKTGKGFVTGGVHAGLRYYFTKVFGLWVEAGYGFGHIKGGLAFKF